MVQRQGYINQLLKFKDSNLIKILAGIRRCGKSTVLDMYKNILIKEFKISKDNIFQKEYTTKELPENYNVDDMYRDIKAAIVGKGHFYLLLDEVQEIDGWEKVVNSLFESYDVDIYITGSNSKLLSSVALYKKYGFKSLQQFVYQFKQIFNMTPKKYKELYYNKIFIEDNNEYNEESFEL